MAPIAPIIQEKIIINLIKLFLTKIIKSIGAIFCQVRMKRVWIHLDVWITWGSQKWRGAAPILIERANKIRGLIKEIELEEFKENIKIDIKIIKIDAKAWAIKYLIEVSVEYGLILLIRRGINLIKLISSPNQHKNHEDEEHAIKVPINKQIK